MRFGGGRPQKIPPEEYWRMALTGEMPGLQRSRAILGRLPSTPRCKLCSAPFGTPGVVLMRIVGGGPSKLNRRICRFCIGTLDEKPGGAEVPVSLLFADVRGSTALAEELAPGEFSRVLARFYGAAARVVDRWDGIVDKFVGDEVVALFIPALAGDDHASRAISAARELLDETRSDGTPWIPVGAGVHSGVSFVGVVGEGDALDFTAVGDPVNTAARLATIADAGEILVSASAAEEGGLDTAGLERRSLSVRGREEPVDVVVVGPDRRRLAGSSRN
jgi:adenylate cyclase